MWSIWRTIGLKKILPVPFDLAYKDKKIITFLKLSLVGTGCDLARASTSFDLGGGTGFLGALKVLDVSSSVFSRPTLFALTGLLILDWAKSKIVKLEFFIQNRQINYFLINFIYKKAIFEYPYGI